MRKTYAENTNLLVRYYEELTSEPVAPATDRDGLFEPAFAYPALDADVAAFLAPATASGHNLDDVGGIGLRLIDFRRNPATHTTKTFPSLLLVARAVEHIRRTGQPILIFSPSSGNKAVALRDAVERALRFGLATPEQLRIVTLTPEATAEKLRRSRLSDDPHLRRLNPVVVLQGHATEAVKKVGAQFVREYSAGPQTAGRVWATLRLDNYRQADVARALYDHEFGSAGETDRRLLHAHAVSSAFGLLGYQAGLARLRARGLTVNQPGYLLVQHLATCDMVLHSLHGDFSRARIPSYRLRDGLWVQLQSPQFPSRTWTTGETLEETFYTHEPATAAEMSGLIAQHGGTGVVVSLLECMERYAQCRHLLRDTDISLPDDPRQLVEWSLVMALTGVLNAIDRGLVPDTEAIVVHASGSYSRADYAPIPADALIRVSDAAGVHAALESVRELARC
jgi:hypothetical protein